MKSRSLALALALAACSAPAFAAEHHGWVYNGATGIAKGSVDGGTSANFDDDSIASNPNIGYRWGMFGIEGGYAFLGKYEHEDAGIAKSRLKAGGWNLGGNVNHNFNDRWSVQGRGGVFFWKGDARIDFVSPAIADIRASDSGNDFYAGASIDYRWGKRGSVGLGYTWFGLDHSDVSLWAVHTEYRF